MTGESLRKKPVTSAGAVQKAYELRLLHVLIFASLTSPALTQAQEAGQVPSADRAASTPASGSTPETSHAPLDTPTSGEADLDERAQRHWGSGMAYLDEDNYAKALEAFEKAFELSGRPRILLAIAVTHERRGDLAQAIATLDEYLRLAPNAENAASIRSHRGELQAQHDEQLQRMSDARKDEAAAPSRVEAGTVPAVARDSTAPPGAPVDGESSRGSDTLMWTAYGVGVASGVAAAASGIMAMKEYQGLQDQCGVGHCSERETRTGRTMAWVSTVLTGVAVVGVGVGVWLTLDAPDAVAAERQASEQVRIGLAYRPSGLTSEVSWSF